MKHRYLIGSYDDEEVLLKATKKIRQAGYQMHEIFTPFPVHGLDHAMGLQETRLHTAGFVIGACGALFAFICMSLISAIDWPIIVGGKPYFTLPTYIPITFEVTVLSASIGMVVIFYIRNGFSIFRDTEVVDPRSTDDRFVMAFCTKKYHSQEDITAIAHLLRETGAVEIKERIMNNEIKPNLLKHSDHGHDGHDGDHHH